MKLELRIINGGSCRQFLGLIDGKSLALTRFEAVFLAIRHPGQGWVIIDCGYGARFHTATSGLPHRLYRYVTPVSDLSTTASLLEDAGINAGEVRHLVITHFHADHIGGLRDFPTATVYYHEDARRPLERLSPFRQTLSGFLPKLIPGDLDSRSREIGRNEFRSTPGELLAHFDPFGDGSILLVDLPGHAPGHIGLLLQGGDRPLLYAADAYWNQRQIEEGLEITMFARKLLWDREAYDRTLATLRKVSRSTNYRIIACHDSATQIYARAQGT